MKISIFQFRKINLSAPFDHLFGDLLEPSDVWLPPGDVPDRSAENFRKVSREGSSIEFFS
jgi:hypothetical protein